MGLWNDPRQFVCMYCTDKLESRFFTGVDLVDHIKESHPDELIKRLKKDAGEA